MKFHIYVKFCLQLTIHIICAIHIYTILRDMLNPKEPSFKTYKKMLQEIDFPISLRLCLEFPEIGGIDKSLEPFGYRNTRDYFIGKSIYNESIIGWSGHFKNGSANQSVKGILVY